MKHTHAKSCIHLNDISWWGDFSPLAPEALQGSLIKLGIASGVQPTWWLEHRIHAFESTVLLGSHFFSMQIESEKKNGLSVTIIFTT